VDQLKPISIVGGGIAGLALGIALRQQAIPVVIHEAGIYPRHRVCGEFISGRGQETLRRLGLLDSLLAAGARPAVSTAFTHGDRAFPRRLLPQPALCLPRFRLDALLADQFRQSGGELRCESRWSDQKEVEGVVYANGRHSRPTESGWRWFGLKAHARNVELSADLEMHLADDVYVGLCRLSSEVVNVCGLFRGGNERESGAASVVERLSRAGGRMLRHRLAAAEWDADSVCAVAGLSLRPRRARESTGCRIGDALTMIAPVSGNGMSMAFESAELSVGPLIAYSKGELSWPETTATVARRCDKAFARRLRWACRFQLALFSPMLRRWGSPLAFGCEPIWRFLFAATR